MSHDAAILTIGHSTHPIEVFVSLLQNHGVTAIADVRSTPASRFNPQFNRDALKRSLATIGIEYVFLGNELGARSDDRSCYVDGRVQYDRLAKAPAYQLGIDRLDRGRRTHRIAVMCSEREPLDCHRAVLVSETFHTRGIPVEHILGDGTIESHEASRHRLRQLHGLADADLFHSTEELVTEALSRQEERIAYVDEDLRETVGD